MILSTWAYLTTDQGVLSSHGFEIIGTLMIIKCIGWFPKKIQKSKVDAWGESSCHSCQQAAKGQAGGWMRRIAPACAPERQEIEEYRQT
jgi:hypothetical protein